MSKIVYNPSKREGRISLSVLFSYYDNELTVHHSIDKSQAKTFFHKHDMFEIFYLISGEGTFRVEESEYDLLPNTVFVFRPNEWHRAYPNNKEVYERVSIHFSKSILNNIVNGELLLECFLGRQKGKSNLLFLKDGANDYVSYCLNRMLKTSNNEEVRRLAIFTGLISILYTLNNEQSTQKMQQRMKSESYLSVLNVIEYIDDNLSENLTLDSISDHFFTSKSSLNRNFKKVTGKTVWSYIIDKRLIVAKSLIDSGTSTHRACALCGFSDYSSFYRRFVSKYNESPKQSQKRE